MSFLGELKRRNVFRVGIAYIVIAWLLAQVADLALENFGTPDWVIKTLLFVLLLGFPLALFFAWAFELTPEGIRKEKDVDRSRSITTKTSRKLDFLIIAVLAVALAYFVFERFNQPEEVAISTSVAQQQNSVPVPVETEPSIAVLPFTDMSPNQDQEYFSDGISEELLNLLMRVEGLKVASRTSSFTYKGANRNITQIAEELKVDHVLEGSVRKADNRVRITAQLIDAATDRHLWSDSFDRDLNDIFSVQDEIANAIVKALRTELGISGELQPVSVEVDTEIFDAYELYLQARALFIARDQLEESIRLFEKAVDLDPKFARAWEGLGAIYGVVESWGITDRDYVALSLEASKMALELNPKLSMPWATLGLNILGSDSQDFARMIEYYDHAISNDAKNSTAYLWRSAAWADLGFMKRALEDTAACLEIDSYYENCRRHHALWLMMDGDPEQALELYKLSAERGFSGTRRGFYHLLMEREGRLAVSAVQWSRQQVDRTFPAKTILDALELPDADHADGLAKFLGWIESTGMDLADWSDTLNIFGAYELMTPIKWDFYLIWSDPYQGYRDSAYFKPMIRNSGALDYWREKVFPPRCRPLGEEDFECD